MRPTTVGPIGNCRCNNPPEDEGTMMAPRLAVLLLTVVAASACGSSDGRRIAALRSTVLTTPTTPTPVPDGRMIKGVVRAPDRQPISGVLVAGLQGTQTTTDGTGAFQLETPAGLHLTHQGYETRDWLHDWTSPGDGPLTVEIFMQPRLVLSEIQPINATLYPDDQPSYVGESYESEYCAICKVVRLRSGVPTVAVVLRWSGDRPLQLWAGTDRAAQSGPSEQTIVVASTGAETLLHVGLPMSTGLDTPEDFTLSVQPR